jgi:predicted MFS family arabinose efflux permease
MNPWEIVGNVFGWFIIFIIFGIAVLILMGLWGSFKQYRAKKRALKKVTYEEFLQNAKYAQIGSGQNTFIQGAIWAFNFLRK